MVKKPKAKPDEKIFKFGVSDLKASLDIIESINSDVVLNFKAEDGMFHVKCVDAAHVSMLVYSFKPQSTEGVTADIVFGVSVENVKKFLSKFAKGQQSVSLVVTDRLTLKTDRHKHAIGFLDHGGMSEPKVPTFKSDFLLATLEKDSFERFRSDIVSLESFSDHMGFIWNGEEDKVTIVYGTDGTDGEITLDCKVTRPGLEFKKVKALFPTDYLKKMVECIPSRACTLHLASDMPVVIDFENGKYLLAPRIETNAEPEPKEEAPEEAGDEKPSDE